jgi:hypothetical protein
MVNRVALFVGVVCLAVAPLAWADAALEAALVLFPASSDVLVSLSPEGQEQLEEAIQALRAELGVPGFLNETNETEVGAFPVALEKKDLVNKLSQAYYTYADVFLRDLPNQSDTFLKGKLWGLKSLRMNPAFAAFEERDGFVAAVEHETDVPALYWTNGNWLRWAEPRLVEALSGGVAKKSLAMSERIVTLDPTYICYGPYRTLAAYWQGLPAGPFGRVFTGGPEQDYGKVLDYTCRVVDEPTLCSGCSGLVDPACGTYFENRLFLAQYYLIPQKLWADAARVLQSILSDPIGELYPLYNALNQQIAATELADIQEHL